MPLGIGIAGIDLVLIADIGRNSRYHQKLTRTHKVSEMVILWLKSHSPLPPR